MELKPVHFIGQPVQVEYDEPPVLEKKPGCPDRFIYLGQVYTVQAILSEWHDYHRRGRMSRNMRPEHAAVAERRGSWGVGQDYYCVRTQNDQIFDLYYDRAPGSVDQRKGGWFLDKELAYID